MSDCPYNLLGIPCSIPGTAHQARTLLQVALSSNYPDETMDVTIRIAFLYFQSVQMKNVLRATITQLSRRLAYLTNKICTEQHESTLKETIM